MVRAKTSDKNREIEIDYLNFLQGEKNSGQIGLLLYGDASAGKTTILADFVYRGVKEDKQRAVFVTFAENPEIILEKLRSFSWNFDKLVGQKKIVFLDASPEVNCEEIGACDTMSPLLERLKYSIKKTKAERVAIDGLQNIFQRIADKTLIRETVFKIVELLRDLRISYIIASEKSPFLNETDLENYLADATVLLEAKKENKRICRSFKVTRIADKRMPVPKDNFKVGSGGLKICSTNSQQIKL